MQKNQSLNELSARIFKEIDIVFKKDNFDLVLVHGDTTTSSIVALAAFHRNLKVAHVEAGLRTYNKQSPFPEELNRQVTGRIADYHFCPTNKASENLIKEGVSLKNILVTGNTVIDALNITLNKIKKGYSNSVIDNLKKIIDFNKRIILITGHRRESFGQGFKNICEAILEISEFENIEIVYPVHLNPNVQKIVYKMLSLKSNIKLINPLDYPSFIWLMRKSTLIISDSGGIQEEAPTLNIPVLVTRNTTEREEGINLGTSFLVGTNKTKIVYKAQELLNSKKSFTIKNNPYGDGFATKRIVDFIKTL